MSLRYISVCSGIEAASVAWRPLGWEAVAFAEIEPFPNAVLEHHFPSVPNLGDISQVDWRPYRGTVDLVVGGTPCQSFSVAGKREGLDGASGLVREYFRLLREVRPRLFIWENVPGCLSSGTPKGRDFEFILQQWADLGYDVAWRILDAQYFGVAQRRRRVFAVGCLGDWRDPVKVLFGQEQVNPALHQDSAERDSLPCFKASRGGPNLERLSEVLFQHGHFRWFTPLERERCFGFPDGWTDIPFKGKPAPDGARYKALGNSMAVPCMAWIGKRIQMVEDGDL